MKRKFKILFFLCLGHRLINCFLKTGVGGGITKCVSLFFPFISPRKQKIFIRFVHWRNPNYQFWKFLKYVIALGGRGKDNLFTVPFLFQEKKIFIHKYLILKCHKRDFLRIKFMIFFFSLLQAKGVKDGFHHMIHFLD